VAENSVLYIKSREKKLDMVERKGKSAVLFSSFRYYSSHWTKQAVLADLADPHRKRL
jgi:hypothetical protein